MIRGENDIDPKNLISLCEQHAVTSINLPPVLLENMFARYEDRMKQLRQLRLIVSGGDRFPTELLSKLNDPVYDRIQILNAYGPTETTITSTIYDMSEHRSEKSNLEPPIGKPVGARKAYILDKFGNIQPTGIPGELCIGGNMLARGYLNQPDLTAEKFINNRYDAGKLYKTGDLARWLPDGNIEFLGRIDHQIKVRGFRIEPGEIEHALGTLGIDNAIVAAKDDANGSKQLIAWTLQSDPFEDNWSSIKSKLSNSLPDYMIPAAFVVLDQLPLTPNGKVDRKALPDPDFTQMQKVYVAPRSSIEETLAGIWQEVLAMDKIGVHDNFFELGGHSLLATQVVSRIRISFSQELSLRDFFQKPSIEELAKQISEAREEAIVIIEKADRSNPLPLSFAQQRLWFIDQYQEGNSANYNMPAALQLKGDLDLNILQESFLRVIQRHESLRTCFETVDDQVYQKILEVDTFKIPLIKLEADDVQSLISEESQTPFNLSSEIPIRAKCLKLSKNEHIFLVTMHHITSDGWSIPIFIQELNETYTSLKEKREAELKTLSIQYADFAYWQRDYLQGEKLDGLLSWWKHELEGIPETLELPLDKARPAEQTYSGDSMSTVIGTELTSKVHVLCDQEAVTPFMLLETAFACLMQRYSQQDDIVIGSPIANRNHTQIEPLIGFFVNTLPLRHHIGPDKSFSDLLKESKKSILDAYDHQDLPFELLVDHLQPQRSLTHSPLFQVMFVLQNNPQETIELPGLTVGLVPVATQSTKFDLTLSVAEVDGTLQCNWEYNTDLFEEDRIIRMRNHVMAERAAPILAEGGAFIAVGALHLPGEEGVVALLRQSGYDVTLVE